MADLVELVLLIISDCSTTCLIWTLARQRQSRRRIHATATERNLHPSVVLWLVNGSHWHQPECWIATLIAAENHGLLDLERTNAGNTVTLITAWHKKWQHQSMTTYPGVTHKASQAELSHLSLSAESSILFGSRFSSLRPHGVKHKCQWVKTSHVNDNSQQIQRRNTNDYHTPDLALLCSLRAGILSVMWGLIWSMT